MKRENFNKFYPLFEELLSNLIINNLKIEKNNCVKTSVNRNWFNRFLKYNKSIL